MRLNFFLSNTKTKYFIKSLKLEELKIYFLIIKMSCSVGLKDIEDFTNELKYIPRKQNPQLTVKRNQKSKHNRENKENEYDKGKY